MGYFSGNRFETRNDKILSKISATGMVYPYRDVRKKMECDMARHFGKKYIEVADKIARNQKANTTAPIFV